MNPDYFIVPLIMGQVSYIITALKTGYIILDCCLLGLLYVVYNNVNVRDVKRRLCALFHVTTTTKQTIVLTSTERRRSVKVRALMFYLANLNKTIYKIREVSEMTWDEDDGHEKEKLSEYLVDQSKEFAITDKIFGTITNNSKEKMRGIQGTEYIEFSTIKIYSYCLTLAELQTWLITIVKAYKQHLKRSSNEQQLYITVTMGKKKTSEQNKGKPAELLIEGAPWESTITFENSYFHEIDSVLKKIDFFLQNKAWYLAKGIPYNLGILLYGEPGCGKTRFIKQLMNHTGRHGIDIKLNDQMDFHDLYNIIFKEELNEDYIIPQAQRILIFEDIDAMGEAVKCRDTKLKQQQKRETECAKVDTASILADLLSNNKHFPEAVTHEALYSTSTNFSSTNNNNLSYLLNMFDGINECSGRIIIMTSNKPEVLDKALIRPGRIDIKINFQTCTGYDVVRLINLFWEMDVREDELLAEVHMKYTSAEIYNLFRSTNDFATIRSLFLV